MSSIDYQSLAIPKPPPRERKAPKPLKRSFTPIAKQSAKARKRMHEWLARKSLAFKASNGLCVAKIAGVCQGRAIDGHHKKPRGRGGHASPCLPTCRQCHDWIGMHSDEAKERGLLL